MSKVESMGDNKEFTSTAIEDITIYFVHTNTSADDTATEKYFNISSATKYLNIRNDQTIQIVSMNDITFTDPITVVINKGHTEKLDVPNLWRMVIRTTTAGTNIKIRFRGR